MNSTYNYQAKKVVIVLSNKLDPGVAMNVVGHLCISIGRYAETDLMGRERLADASSVIHLGIAKYPVIVTQVKPSTVRKALEQARQNPNILVADFPRQMLDTGHDDELSEAMAAALEPALEYLGAILYGLSDDVNLITGKYSLWK
jgi:SepF-like predicted cell division protein (DUF552 family)